jgi:hypothetical protein
MRIASGTMMGAAGGALAVGLVATGCALFEPRATSYVAPPVGATWTTARRDTGSYGSGSAQVTTRRGERSWQGAPAITFEGVDVTTLAIPNGDWIGQFRGATPLVTWDPPLGWDWPLVVGKSWTRDQRATIAGGKQTLSYRMTQKVEAYEQVTVPAGTFGAFRIVTTDTLGNENVNWFSPDLGFFVKSSLRRTGKHSQGAGTREAVLVSHKR